MNYIYVAVAILLLGGAYYFVTSPAKQKNDTSVPSSQSETSQTDTVDTMEENSEADSSVSEPESGLSITGDAEVSVSASEGEIKTFDLRGVNFAYDVEEIRVSEGDTVTINFQSDDGYHDWVVDEFDAATEKVRPGTPTSVTFKADKAGTYEFYCSVGSHRAQGMVGTLIVE